MIALLLLGCQSEPFGPESLGYPIETYTAYAQLGEREVSMLTWQVPEGSEATAVSFVILVADCDIQGSCWWTNDYYHAFDRVRDGVPVKTQVQRTFELCWPVHADGGILAEPAVPSGAGTVAFPGLFRAIPEYGEITLSCTVTEGLYDPGSFGVSLDSITLQGEDEYGTRWRGTFANPDAGMEHVRTVIVQR